MMYCRRYLAYRMKEHLYSTFQPTSYELSARGKIHQKFVSRDAIFNEQVLITKFQSMLEKFLLLENHHHLFDPHAALDAFLDALDSYSTSHEAIHFVKKYTIVNLWKKILSWEESHDFLYQEVIQQIYLPISGDKKKNYTLILDAGNFLKNLYRYASKEK